jgi:hypothetical protein
MKDHGSSEFPAAAAGCAVVAGGPPLGARFVALAYPGKGPGSGGESDVARAGGSGGGAVVASALAPGIGGGSGRERRSR